MTRILSALTLSSFPRSAWERTPGRSASRLGLTRDAERRDCIPTWSVATRSSLTRILSALAFVLAFCTPLTHAEDWQPAKGPLMTRWAKDVAPDTVHPEYPRPQMVRKDWMNLNGLWQLAIGKEGDAPPIGKTLEKRILVPFPVESALSGVMQRADRLWYRRTFKVPESWTGKRTLLHFGAVDWEATVWVNGKELGKHRGGYDAFSFDITDALRKDGEQEIVVGVYDPTDGGTQPRGKQVRKPQGIYYTPTTGIWQTVWLEPVANIHVESVKILTDINKGTVKLTIEPSVKGARITGNVVLKEPVGWVTVGGIKADGTISFRLNEKALWSPEKPTLIQFIVELQDENKKPIDTVDGYFGMRKIEVKKDDQGIPRLFLNNKPYFQVGPLDQGFWPDGLYTAPTDEALKYDIEVTKKLGFNMIRKHVKVEPQRWYYWCDKLGILVWQDMPSGDRSIAPGKPDIVRSPESAKQYETELKAMIDGLRNHPCIIMWVPFNEGWGQFDTARITKWIKEYDPTRLVDCASGWNDHAGVGDVHDIHVYPGPGAPKSEEKRAGVLGEFGGLGLPLKEHMWEAKSWSYQGTASSAELTRKYEQLLKRVHELKEKSGLSAAVYTQTTDVETEINGLMTYDRAVIKVDVDRVAAINKGDTSKMPKARVIVPTSQEKGIVWHYTFAKPADGWQKPGFDDTSWKEGTGGFGTQGTPGAVVRTVWNTADIWLRREFTLPEGKYDNLWLNVHHDEDVEIYLNGVLAARVARYVTDYTEITMSPEARATLKAGKNTIAVHCHQTTGGQYIDVGMVEVK
jgi:hypothetical protein